MGPLDHHIGRRIKLQDLRILMAVAQVGSMNKAAALLNSPRSQDLSPNWRPPSAYACLIVIVKAFSRQSLAELCLIAVSLSSMTCARA